MRKKIFIILCLSIFGFTGLYAQDEAAKEKKIGYSVALDVANTYIWRGYDIYAGTNSVFNTAFGLFPSITLSVPEGFSFNIWGAAALSERDTAVNLTSVDEIDFTGSYSIEDKSGSFGASMVAYVYPGSTVAASYGELIFSYAAPWEVLNPSVLIGSSFGGFNAEYAALSISHEFTAGILSIGPKLLFGYWFSHGDSSGNKGHIDLTIPFGLAINDNFEVHAGITGSYRLPGFDDGEPFILVANIGTSYSF